LLSIIYSFVSKNRLKKELENPKKRKSFLSADFFFIKIWIFSSSPKPILFTFPKEKKLYK